MDCKQTQQLFTAYLDRDLETELAGQVKDHLASCQSCRMEFASFNQTVEYLHAMEQLKAPSDLLPGIHAKLDQQGYFAKIVARWRRFDFSMSLQSATATIAIAFAIMAVVKTFPIGQQTNPDTSQTSIAQYNQSTQTHPPRRQPQNLPFRSFSDRGFLRPQSQPVFDSFTPRDSKAFSPYSGISSLQERLSNLSPLGGYTRINRPDMTVSASDLSPSLQASLYNSLISDNSWQTNVSDDEVIIYLRPDKIRKLHRMLSRHMISLPLNDLHNPGFNPHKKVWTVAVQLR